MSLCNGYLNSYWYWHCVSTDAGISTDAGTDTGVGTDAGTDTSIGTDAGTDTGVGTDAGTDTGIGTDAVKVENLVWKIFSECNDLKEIANDKYN